MKCFSVLVFWVLLYVSLFAADQPSADVLNRWVGGKWVSDGEFLETAYSKAAKASAVSTCAWSPDHVFVVCDQDITFSGAPMRNLSVYAFDPKESKYHFYGLAPDGDRPRTGSLEISADGTHWVYLGSGEIGGKTVQFRTINEFHGSDQVDWWSEASADDGKTWIKTASGKEARQR